MLILACISLFSIISVISTDVSDRSTDNNFRFVKAGTPGDTLRSVAVDVSAEHAFAYNPYRVHNLDDNFLIVQDFRNSSFFTTFSWETLELKAQWGEISRGPEPYEFQNYPFQTISDGAQLVTVDAVAREVRTLKVDKQEAGSQSRSPLVYRPETGVINRLIRLRDDLYFAQHESYSAEHGTEWVAFSPEEDDDLFLFGSYPGEPDDGMPTRDYFDKHGMANPGGDRAAVFYSRHNALKIFDDTGRELHAKIIAYDDAETDGSVTPAQVFANRAVYPVRVPQWADDDYIFTLRFVADNEETISHLEIWNWDGELLYHAPLDRPVSAITASKKHRKVVGVSNEHESTLWVWELEEGLFEK